MATFQQTWHVGRRVKEKAPPGRTGHIRARAGTGANARITVALDGHPPVTLHPAQLILL